MESRTMRMYLQSMPKKGFVCVFTLFFVLLVAAILIGASGPQINDHKCPMRPRQTTCESIDFSKPSPWVGNITNLDELNQQLYLVMQTVHPKLQSDNKTAPHFEFTATVHVSGSGHRMVVGEEASEPEALPRGPKNRTIVCRENHKFCDNVTIAHYPFIQFTNYMVKVEIEPKSAQDNMKQVFFEFVFTDHKFTLFELWFRFAFLLITFVFIIVFAHKLRHYRWTDWQVEQKWTAFILFGLMAANNPFFPLEILVAGWFPVFLDQLLMVTFLCMLLLFWLIMFDGVRKDAVQRSLLKFYIPKFCLVVALWIVLLVVFTWQELHLLTDPEYSEVSDDGNFIVFMLTMLTLLVIYVFWVLYVVVRACMESKTYPLLGVRIRFFGFFTLMVICAVVGGVLFSWWGPVHNNAAEFLTYIALLNLYVYVLAFMYLPSKSAFGAKQRGQGDKLGVVRFEDEQGEEIDH